MIIMSDAEILEMILRIIIPLILLAGSIFILVGVFVVLHAIFFGDDYHD